MNTKAKKILKNGCFGILGLGLILLISLSILFKQAFGTIEEEISIKQNIGGELICKSTYTADLQSWYYFIDYEYKKTSGDTLKIGKGEYYGREWDKKQQLIEIGDWLILQTGGEFKTDRLLIGNKKDSIWKTFEISPYTIEKDNLWISKKIYVKQSWSPQESFIKQINGNKIEVEYLYRIGEKVEEQETRLITFEFDERKGLPIMTKIEM